MQILTISGSSRLESSNVRFLKGLSLKYSENSWVHFEALDQLPLFRPQDDHPPFPEKVEALKKAILQSDAVIFSTPEYLHNIPAQLKNALEWLTTAGELSGKAVIAITYTPKEPRGEKAMQSLLWSLKALNANLLCSLSLYQNEIVVSDKFEVSAPDWILEMLEEALSMLNK
jgi:chromate reductase